MTIIHLKSGTVLGKNVKAATTFWPRLMGFMLRKSAAPYDGLFIAWCNAVHNCFVFFSLDVIFINKDHVVVKILRDFRPWRVSMICFRARHAIEFTAGAVPSDVVVGDQLVLEGLRPLWPTNEK